MTITLTDQQVSVLQREAAERNAASPDTERVTAEGIAQKWLDDATQSCADNHTTADRAAMVPLADALLAAPAQTRNAILTEVRTKLGL